MNSIEQWIDYINHDVNCFIYDINFEYLENRLTLYLKLYEGGEKATLKEVSFKDINGFYCNFNVHNKFDKTITIDTNWYLEEISYFKEGIGKLQNGILGNQVFNANFLIETNGTLLAIESKSVYFDSKEYQVLNSHEKTKKKQRNYIIVAGIKKFFSRREDSSE
ncbi:hypothetical protein NRS6084_00211 [Bacillus subtilis]|uniref:YxiG family protein n=1 Tax=Bacillus TaxID=1386 RepID=UPI0009571D7D|nr:hypothetical protein [Bacillus subtilis]CAF1719072.1 hypothetical protein NRS6084_00211 [Bacillus subtilis]SIP97116.1 hypothetical protein SAMN05878487_0219 [Bacillus subtilis]